MIRKLRTYYMACCCFGLAKPNAALQARGAAAATQERRLFPTACKRWFGKAPASCEPHPGLPARLLDHLIRQDEERRGERDPEGVGRLQVEHQVELGGLLHRQVRWFHPL